MKSGESSCFSSIAIVLLGFRSPNLADLQSFSEPMRSSIPETVSKKCFFEGNTCKEVPVLGETYGMDICGKLTFLGGETTVFHGFSCDFALKHIDKRSKEGSKEGSPTIHWYYLENPRLAMAWDGLSPCMNTDFATLNPVHVPEQTNHIKPSIGF